MKIISENEKGEDDYSKEAVKRNYLSLQINEKK